MNTTTKKISRNKACPCGSGKKFKRCCGKDQEPGNQPKILQGPDLPIQGPDLPSSVEQAALKNDFRNQVNPFAGIPGEELVRRDQMVLLAKLETTFSMEPLDREYFQNIIHAFTELKAKIQKFEPSPERGPTLTDIEAQIVEFTKRAKTVPFSRTNFLNLCALRSVLEPKSGEAEDARLQQLANKYAVKNSHKGETQVEDDKVIEQAMGNTGQAPAQQQETKPRGDGPIEDSGGGSPDGDFQNEPPDAVEQQALGNVK